MKKLLQKGKFALSLSKGFTLIELLIVIGILGILVVAVLLTLNPQDAQRKARDAGRVKDLTELQAAIDQWVNDPSSTIAAVAAQTSAGGTTACAANGNWTTLNLCNYINTVPVDPSNNQTRSVAGATGATACPTTNTITAATVYRFQMAANGEYEINVRQESASNCTKLTRDGGDSNAWAELGTDPSLNLMTD